MSYDEEEIGGDFKMSAIDDDELEEPFEIPDEILPEEIIPGLEEE